MDSVKSPSSSSSSSSNQIIPIEQTPQFNQIYEQIKSWVNKEGPVTAVSVISFVTRVMGVVQKAVTERNKGKYKKQLVLSLMRKLISEIKMSETDRVAILSVLETVVGGAMDVIVGVATGQIDINKVFLSCSSCCLPLKKK